MEQSLNEDLNNDGIIGIPDNDYSDLLYNGNTITSNSFILQTNDNKVFIKNDDDNSRIEIKYFEIGIISDELTINILALKDDSNNDKFYLVIQLVFKDNGTFYDNICVDNQGNIVNELYDINLNNLEIEWNQDIDGDGNIGGDNNDDSLNLEVNWRLFIVYRRINRQTKTFIYGI